MKSMGRPYSHVFSIPLLIPRYTIKMLARKGQQEKQIGGADAAEEFIVDQPLIAL